MPGADSDSATAGAARAARLTVSGEIGEVSTLLLRPGDARWLLVLAHGAGTDLRHRQMAATAQALATAGIATLRRNLSSGLRHEEQGITDWPHGSERQGMWR
jgi:hypothetical protein